METTDEIDELNIDDSFSKQTGNETSSLLTRQLKPGEKSALCGRCSIILSENNNQELLPSESTWIWDQFDKSFLVVMLVCNFT